MKTYSDHESARTYFEQAGYTVLPLKNKSANGPDLEISSRYNMFRVEVKRAVKGTRYWKVKPVQQKRKHDDLVAIVFPDNSVWVFTMKDHLRLCSKDGSRQITDLVRFMNV